MSSCRLAKLIVLLHEWLNDIIKQFLGKTQSQKVNLLEAKEMHLLVKEKSL